MRIVLTGLNHRSAPLATREALSVTRGELPGALRLLHEEAERGVLLFTCNRMEVYVAAADAAHGRAAIDRFLTRQFGVSPDDVRPHLYTLEQEEAVEHLYRVAASLDSLIIGESEILGQVRDAFGEASRNGAAGGVLARVFHEALRVGKRARTETGIGRNARSVSGACVEMARRALGDLRPLRALVVGVGDAGALAARALRDAGLTEITVTSRTAAHAEGLATDLGAGWAPLDELPTLLRDADVVLSSTGSPDFVVPYAAVADAMAARPEQPLFIIDIALPRDVDPSAGSIPGVHLYTMYDLEMVAESNRREREAETHHVEEIIAEEMARFRAWWDSRRAAPTIRAMHERAEEMREAEVARMLKSADGLSAKQRAAVDAMSRALVKKLLHAPTRALRARGDDAPLMQTARELLGLDGDAGREDQRSPKRSAAPP